MPITKSNFDSEDCSSYSKDDLVEFAKKLKLPYTGTKSKICERINEHLGSLDKKKPSSKKKDKKGDKNNDGDDDFDVVKCSSYTVVQLKEYCKKYGLKISGTKSELCNRLQDKFSCDLPKKKNDSDDAFNPKKCEGDKPVYSKYELEKFANANKVSVKKSDTKRAMCDKLVSKTNCKELIIVEIDTKKKKKKPIEIEIESDEEEPKPKKKPSKKRKVKELESEEESIPKKKSPKKKSPRKVSPLEDFDDKKCGDKPRYLKSKIISYAEKYGLETSGTAKDICIRIKDHLSDVGKKVPEIVEDVLEELESESESSSESEDEIESQGTLTQLKSELTKTNSKDILKKYSHLISSNDLENFKKLDIKDQTLFINLFNNNDSDFHTFLEYFIKERDYKRFFSVYTVRTKKGMSSKDIIKEFGHLLDKLVLAKFNILSDKKKLSIAKKYLTSTQSINHFIPIDECRSDYYEHCSENKEVCNIDLGQCVREKDLDHKYDGIEIDGNRIIGSKDSLETLKKKLNIKSKEEIELEEEEDESEKVIKRLLKPAIEFKKQQEKEELKRKYEKRLKEEEDHKKVLEHERQKRLKREKEEKEESGYIDQGRLAPASPRLKKPSDKPYIDLDLLKQKSPFKPRSKPKIKSPIIELEEGDIINEEESEDEEENKPIIKPSIPSGEIALDKLKDLFGTIEKEGSLFKKTYKGSEKKSEKQDELKKSLLDQYKKDKLKEKESDERREREKEQKRQELREKEDIAEREARESLADMNRKRLEAKNAIENEKREKQREKERLQEERDRERERLEKTLKPLIRKDVKSLDDESRRKIRDEVERREDELILEELPTKENLLSLAKELDKPQKEIARCLGLIP